MNEQVGNQGKPLGEIRGQALTPKEPDVSVGMLPINNRQQASTVIQGAIALLGIPEDVAREANNTLNLLRSYADKVSDPTEKAMLQTQVVNLERALGAGNDNLPTAFKKSGSSTEIVNDPDLHARAVLERQSRERSFEQAARRGDEKVRQAAGAKGQKLAVVLTEDDFANAARFTELENERKGEIALAYAEGYEKGYQDAVAKLPEKPLLAGLSVAMPDTGSKAFPIGANEQITDVVDDPRDGSSDTLGLGS